jgi:hypothetical protein
MHVHSIRRNFKSSVRRKKSVAFFAAISDDCWIRNSTTRQEKSVSTEPVTTINDSERHILRHSLATIAYRGSRAMRGATEEFGRFRATETCRTPDELLAHLGDLVNWSLSYAIGAPKWEPAPVVSWEEGKNRFFTALKKFDDYLASGAPVQCSMDRLFQGPIADALTHIGQIAILRRVAGVPIMKGENMLIADITIGRVGEEQAPPRREF